MQIVFNVFHLIPEKKRNYGQPEKLRTNRQTDGRTDRIELNNNRTVKPRARCGSLIVIHTKTRTTHTHIGKLCTYQHGGLRLWDKGVYISAK